MRKNFPVLIVFLLSGLIIGFSCEKEKENTLEKKLNLIKGDGYFPLNVGNYWKLSFIPERKIDSIISVDGKDYYRLISDGTSYIRKTKEGKIYLRTANSHEILKYDLSAEVGKTWTYKFDNSEYTWYATLSSKNDTIKLNNYTFYNCYRFYYDVPQLADEEHIIWLAPDIGFVEEAYLGGTSERKKLEKVIINGVDIGF